jgi:hypothetical protein
MMTLPEIIEIPIFVELGFAEKSPFFLKSLVICDERG